jgi:DNA replication protein DnaC
VTEVIVECGYHGKQKAYKLELFGQVIEQRCPECVKIALEAEQKAKDIELDQKYKEMARQAEIDRNNAYRAMNIEPHYRECSLDNFQAETLDQKKALSAAKRIIGGEVKKLFLTGKNGTGKTHLACACVIALKGRILTMYEISTMIRQSYTAKATLSELEIVDDLASIPILVIDEIGRTKGSESEHNWLSYIIDKRHCRNLPMILITNKHTRKACESEGCADCVENYLSEDMTSRLANGSIMVTMTGEDYRRKA